MPDLPEPLVPAEVDLRDFAFTPMYRGRLFGSGFNAKVSDSAWRAGVTLWLKSWDQVPAGTLPDDEVELCRLAELGRDTKTWRKLAKEALWGWFRCSDGRLHHKVVAEGVMEAWERKTSQRDRTAKARATALSRRQSQEGQERDTEDVTKRSTRSVTEPATGSKGQGQGQGQKKDNPESAQPYDPVAAQEARSKRLEPHDDGPDDEFRRAERACFDALGGPSCPGSADLARSGFAPIILLKERGFRFESILTVLRSEAQRPRRKPIRTWELWAQIVVERLAEMPPGNPPEPPESDNPTVDFGGGYTAPLSTIRMVLARGTWLEQWGPKPGEMGCRVPAELMREVAT